MTQNNESEVLLEKLERLKAEIPNMNMFRDLFAQAVLMDNASCEHILHILTGNKSLVVKKNNIQHLISKLTSHNIIMDVLVEDANHKLYEIEIQKADGNIAHEKRMLYYAASIINDYFFKGDQTYDSVPELHIFYISETDIWKKGKTFYKVCKYLNNVDTPYDDGLHMYYINAAIDDGSAIAGLMKYFKTANANDFSQGSLSKRINTLKTQEGGLNFMDDLIKEVLDIGKNKEKIDTAKRMLHRGKSTIEEIAEDTQLSVTTVKQLQAEMLQPV